jgi:glycosyltransferase involved in cell wall biosynthesis
VLTGPARGYVKNQLDKMRIPYMHCCVKDVNDMPNYYRILDVYLITSRSEGGPKALLEAWATGIPLVSTRVGMVHDIAHDGIDALLAEKEASDELVSQLLRVYRNDQLRQCLIRNALEQVCNYTWSSMAQVYKQYIYEKMGCKNHD